MSLGKLFITVTISNYCIKTNGILCSFVGWVCLRFGVCLCGTTIFIFHLMLKLQVEPQLLLTIEWIDQAKTYKTIKGRLWLIRHYNYFANEIDHKNEFSGNIFMTLCPCKYHDQESCHVTNTLIFHWTSGVTSLVLSQYRQKIRD
jgi:hypothetical protein